ncbi:MAG: hypothetical protein AAGD10_06285 [Myxococcota bacterium]
MFDLDVEVTSVLDLVVTLEHIYKVNPQGVRPSASGEAPVFQDDFSTRLGLELSLGR